LMAEAINAAETDRRVKEVIGLRNRLDSLVRNTQRTFKEFGSALSTGERERGQRTLNDGEEAALSDDPDEIRRATQAVEQLATQLTMAMMGTPSAATALDPNERL
ncbi:MAG TPA: Hsp70 family protein, partial [Pyrinomonadaceae bacterium]|nr:Hsp70 family protein [Pyrinomonadaceae bacterium]